jgi:uncharacterized protein YbjT (DUF2867 family)
MSDLEGPRAPGGGLIFVTGASGYVGGRLVPALLAEGYSVRCLAREPRKLRERPWRSHSAVSVVAGDMSDQEELVGQLQGCRVAFYLVHSMEATDGAYAEHDRQLAANFAQAAARAGVERIVYLGGLGEMGDGLSRHLSSRREVEEQLASTSVPVTSFRAAMIIGAGSASFEILRYLVERLPVMVTPKWVQTESQPVAIADVLHWLVRGLSVPETTGQTLELGGPNVLTYRELMRIMAEELRLPARLIIPLPVLTPRLSSLWISFVTPVSYRIARPLGEGLKNRVVVINDETQRLMPHATLPVREAIRQAIQQVEANEVETRWSAAGPIPGDPRWAGGTVFKDQRSVLIQADPSAVFSAICRIGGGHGWYAGDILWRIRGWMDKLVGGPGLRRGRRNAEQVEFGEALDFWRVVGIERNRSLSLLAEMKLPGAAMLNFELEPEDEERITLTMTAKFRPKGLLGILYWYSVLPLHDIVFGGMLRGIRTVAESSRRRDEAKSSVAAAPYPVASGYGRARLWLGISAVGTFVTLTTLGLLFDLPSWMQQNVGSTLWGQAQGILGFVLLYAAIQLPFDVLGGYFLPKRFGRSHQRFPSFLTGLGRGVVAHGALLFLASMTILLAGQWGGILGTVAAGVLVCLVLLRGRVALATLMAPLRLKPIERTTVSTSDSLPIAVAESLDEGFTGAVVGVFRPRLQIVPQKWRGVLGADGFNVALRRRALAVKSGSWRRGRAVAFLFTVTGLAIAASLVGSARLGTVGGTVAFSLWFSLWSFLGLLTLPTLSRRGVIETDERAHLEGQSPETLRSATRLLDELQDGEPTRPALIETIFHPIPSVQNRLEGPRSKGRIGFWDAARCSVYLSIAGLGLLGRAVHCNCGRPSLWVFLPTD